MSRRQGTGLRPFGGDWFGRCGGWHAIAMRGRYVTHADARITVGETAAEEMRHARAALVWGKVVICQQRADGKVHCGLITRESAAELLADLQMALAR